MRHLNPQDDRWLSLESPTTHFQIGALLLFDLDRAAGTRFTDIVRAHLAERIPIIPLHAVYHPGPFGFDTGVWLERATFEPHRHVRYLEGDEPIPRAVLNAFVAEQVMRPLDLDVPPFRITVFDRVDYGHGAIDGPATTAGHGAIILQVHHSFADGMGFQSIVSSLTDPSPGTVLPADARHGSVGPADARPGRADERPPRPIPWLAGSARRFAEARRAERRTGADRTAAAAELAAFRARPETRRARTPPVPGLDGPNSADRSFESLSLPLAQLGDVGRAWGGTVNDAFLTLVGGALRRYLDETSRLDALGDAPLVAMVPKSRRQASDGELGNHLGFLLPQLATNLADPRARFDAVHQSMRTELARSEIAERMTPTTDRPFGARRRRHAPEEGTQAGNVSLSNVPGPREDRCLGGYRMAANFPLPTLPAGQFLNITLRRYGGSLDLGIMVDAVKVPDIAPIRMHLLAELAALSVASGSGARPAAPDADEDG